MSHIEKYDSSFQDSISQAYLGGVGTQISTSDLESQITSLQDQLLKQIALLRVAEATQNSKTSSPLTAEWYYSLVHEYPELCGLQTYSRDGDTTHRLMTQMAPLEFVYNGDNCFYTTTNSLGYKLNFCPGYVWVESRTTPTYFNRRNNVFSEREYDHSMKMFFKGTHPHAADGGSGGFSNMCTGSDNPFRVKLRGKALRDSLELASLLKLSMRWMRTYNVNDSYGNPAVLIKHPERSSDYANCMTPSYFKRALTDYLQSNSKEYAWFVDNVTSALADVHALLKDFDCVAESAITEREGNSYNHIRGLASTTKVFVHDVRALNENSDFCYPAGLQKCTDLLLPNSSENYNQLCRAWDDTRLFVASEQIRKYDLGNDVGHMPPLMLLRFGTLLQLYQTLYAWFMLLYNAEEHRVILSWYAAYPLFLLDATMPAVHSSLERNIATSKFMPPHLLLPYITHLQTRKQSTNSDPTPIENFYSKQITALDNLWGVIDHDSAREHSALAKLYRATHPV